MQSIVLQQVRYADNKSIVHVYSADRGMVAFMVSRGSSQRSRRFAPLFSPLSIVDIIYEHKNRRDVQIPKEVQALLQASAPTQSPVANAVAGFLLEWYAKLLHPDNEGDEEIFSLISESIRQLDRLDDQGVASLHLHSMAQLLRPLGISPDLDHYQAPSRLLCDEGSFAPLSGLISDSYKNEAEATDIIVRLLKQPLSQPLALNRRIRSISLDLLLRYYQYHVPHIGPLKSLSVLQQLF